MKILKKLFNSNDAKIHIDEIAMQMGGIPTLLSGAVIVESGSNAKGRYVKFGDGTMLCHMRIASISVYTEIQLPESYIDQTYQVLTTMYLAAADRSKGVVLNVGLVNNSVINITPYPISGQTLSTGVTLFVMTIGRWK